MSESDRQECSEAISTLLSGTQLDTFRVYSAILQLGFVRMNHLGDLPAEVWVTISGDLKVDSQIPSAIHSIAEDDFFARRALAIASTYLLIGNEVLSARVTDTGSLEIGMQNGKLVISPDPDWNFEEVWAVMSDTADANASPPWYVSFDDCGNLALRHPG